MSREIATFIGLALLVGAVIGGLLGFLAWRGLAAAAEARVAERVLVAIPAGTGERLATGGAAGAAGASGGTGDPALDAGGLPPSSLKLATGDTLVLRNDDTRAHQVGAYSIAPGAALELTVDAADSGTFRCSFNAAGSFALDVAPPLRPSTVIVPAILIGLPLGGIVGVVGWIARSIGEPAAPRS
jgi:hypothetical protein